MMNQANRKNFHPLNLCRLRYFHKQLSIFFLHFHYYVAQYSVVFKANHNNEILVIINNALPPSL